MKNKITSFLTVALLAVAFNAVAQEQTDQSEVTTEQPASEVMDANDVRYALDEILRSHPTELSTVLALDPSLLGNPEYLSTYPRLAEFVAQHPEIRHNPRFFLSNAVSPEPGRTSTERIVNDMAEGIAMVVSFLAFVLGLAWLIRTFVEQRRWGRLSKTQAEVHNKILDRLTSNEELIAYIESPAGKRFLESTPIMLDSEAPRRLPINRILWSAQVGIIISAGAVGLLLVSGRFADAAQPIFAMGAIALCIGLGFIISGGLSLYVSHRLGLWDLSGSGESVHSGSELV